MAQELLQMVQSNSEIHGPMGIYEAYRRMYAALGIDNIESLIQPPPQPQPPMPIDAGLENAMLLQGMPAQAFPEQNHQVHIETHLAFLQNDYVQTNPVTVGLLVSHILEHISFMAQMQAEQELQMQLQQNPELALQIQQQELMNQQAMAQGQPPMPNVLLENLKAQAELTLTQELMPRLDAILQTGQGDATAKLKAQELEIRAQENADDKEIAEKRLELDEEKLKSQEDIAAMKIEAQRNKGG